MGPADVDELVAELDWASARGVDAGAYVHGRASRRPPNGPGCRPGHRCHGGLPRREAAAWRRRPRRPARAHDRGHGGRRRVRRRRPAGGSATFSSTRHRTSTRSSIGSSTCSARAPTTCSWSATRRRRSTGSTGPTRRSSARCPIGFPGSRSCGSRSTTGAPRRSWRSAPARSGPAITTSDRVGPTRRPTGRDRQPRRRIGGGRLGRLGDRTSRPDTRPYEPRAPCWPAPTPCWHPPGRRWPSAVSPTRRRSTAPARRSLRSWPRPTRFRDGDQLRRWAHDHARPVGAEDDAATEVAAAVLAFLRDQPDRRRRRIPHLGRRPPIRSGQPARRRVADVPRRQGPRVAHGSSRRVRDQPRPTSLGDHAAPRRAEEARLLYVALTRATDALTVNWAERRGGYLRKLTPFLDGFASEAPPLLPPPESLISMTRSSQRRRSSDSANGGCRPHGPPASCPMPSAPITCSAPIAEQRPATPAELDRLTGLGGSRARRLFERMSGPHSD